MRLRQAEDEGEGLDKSPAAVLMRWSSSGGMRMRWGFEFYQWNRVWLEESFFCFKLGVVWAYLSKQKGGYTTMLFNNEETTYRCEKKVC